MLFVDLESLKINKQYNFVTNKVTIEVNLLELGLKEFQQKSVAVAREILVDAPKSNETCFYVLIEGEGETTTEEKDAFLSFVNVFSTVFFKEITTNDRRDREYRLDVPENLKVLNTSLSAIKPSINYKTIVNKLNLTIVYKDLVYLLCDKQKETEEQITETTKETEVC